MRAGATRIRKEGKHEAPHFIALGIQRLSQDGVIELPLRHSTHFERWLVRAPKLDPASSSMGVGPGVAPSNYHPPRWSQLFLPKNIENFAIASRSQWLQVFRPRETSFAASPLPIHRTGSGPRRRYISAKLLEARSKKHDIKCSPPEAQGTCPESHECLIRTVRSTSPKSLRNANANGRRDLRSPGCKRRQLEPMDVNG